MNFGAANKSINLSSANKSIYGFIAFLLASFGLDYTNASWWLKVITAIVTAGVVYWSPSNAPGTLLSKPDNTMLEQ
jgi:hypothetical protein